MINRNTLIARSPEFAFVILMMTLLLIVIMIHSCNAFHLYGAAIPSWMSYSAWKFMNWVIAISGIVWLDQILLVVKHKHSDVVAVHR
jgi:hypothetical protein